MTEPTGHGGMKKGDALADMPALAEAVNAVCRKASSEARQRQIRSHARELVRALQHHDHPLTVADDLAEVFDRPSLMAYDKLALAGELRDRGEKRPTSEATANIRSGVMVLLQRELGLPVRPLRTLVEVPRKTPVDVARGERMRTSLQTVADYIGRQTRWTADGGLMVGSYPRWVRMLAMASVVLDTGARVGELCALRLENLSPDMQETRVVRRPQNARPGDPVVTEVFPLRSATQAALQRWLLVRRLVMTGVTGGADWVWVSVRGNHAGVVDEEAGPSYRPAGAALQPRGVSRAYTAAVARVNVELAGSEGWNPLPERMEQLRRGVATPDLLVVPPAPDSQRAAEQLQRLQDAGRALAVLTTAEDAATTGQAARDQAREALREAWRQGVDHQVQLVALAEAGLIGAATSRAGWSAEMLRALDRAAR